MKSIVLNSFKRLKHYPAREEAVRVPGFQERCDNQNQANREQWLKSVLAAFPTGHRILDAGAGELQYKHFCAHLNYVSQDFAQYDGQGDRLGLQVGKWDANQVDIVSDITSIPEPDNAYDAVMCVEVLEHLPYPVEALRELTRVLKPGGKLILTAPFCSLTHFSPYFYQSGYSRYFYEYWLGQFGYNILDMQFNGNYFEWSAQELRRLPQVSQQYAHVRPSALERICMRITLGFLARASKSNSGSEQLLCFGLHILAEKR